MPQRLARVALVRDRLVAVVDLRPPVAGADGDLIEARGAHLLLDRSLRAGADRHHRQHRGHADGDAEHGQAGLQPIAAERLERDVDHGMPQKSFHFKAPTLSERFVRKADGTRVEWVRPIRHDQPVPEINGARAVGGDVALVRDHHDGDARASRRGCAKISITSWLVEESRLPVGSSASSNDGCVTSARAIATRCCWPPDSWLG